MWFMFYWWQAASGNKQITSKNQAAISPMVKVLGRKVELS